MGITKNCSRFLFYLRSTGVSFEKTITLGRMRLYAKKQDIQAELERFKIPKNGNEVEYKDDYSEPLFQLLGAKQIDSIDYSDYENATFVHDMNQPIGDALKNKYSAVFDGGTLEHVFNFPVAIRNCMEMLQTGGHYIGITPANNTMGHGFYQFSPELLYNVFSAENGFEVKRMLMFTEDQQGNYSDWYEVMNPARVNSRVTLVNAKPTYIMVLAQKQKQVPVFSSNPQQSDYQTTWAIHKALNENKRPVKQGRVKYAIKKITPRPLRIFFRNLVNMFTKEKVNDENLGQISAENFKKFEIPRPADVSGRTKTL